MRRAAAIATPLHSRYALGLRDDTSGETSVSSERSDTFHAVIFTTLSLVVD